MKNPNPFFNIFVDATAGLFLLSSFVFFPSFSLDELKLSSSIHTFSTFH